MSGLIKKNVNYKRAIVIATLAIGVVGSIVAIALFSGRDGVSPNGAAFGKLSSVNQLGSPESSFALGVPARPGVQEMIVSEEYKYEWIGKSFPKMPKVAKVYKRLNTDWDLDRIKKLARQFALSDDSVDLMARFPEESIDGSRERGNLITPAPGADIEEGISGQEDELQIYRFSSEDNRSYLEVYGRDGRFFYENLFGEVRDGELPSKKEAIEIAKDFLKKIGLDDKGLSAPKATESGMAFEEPVSISADSVEEKSPRRVSPSFIEVAFFRVIEGNQIFMGNDSDGYRAISIMVGPGEDIISVSGELPAETESSDYPLMDIEEAFKKIEEGVAGVGGSGLPEPDSREGPESFSRPRTEPLTEAVEGVQVEGRDVSLEAVTATVSEAVDEPIAESPQVEPVPDSNPDFKEPKIKKSIINIELDKVELIYTIVLNNQGVIFYQPGYLFSGQIDGSEFERSVLVDAIDEKYLDN